MKKCPNKNKTSTSKLTTSNTEECEHHGVEGHGIDHYYSLRLELHPSKSINKKDDKGEGGCGGGDGSPQVRC
jgi:hypothetical protein